MRGELTIGDIFSQRGAGRAAADRGGARRRRDDLRRDRARRANAWHRALDGLGVRRGDRVVVWSSTTLDLVPLFAALARMGAVFAPIGRGAGYRRGHRGDHVGGTLAPRRRRRARRAGRIPGSPHRDTAGPGGGAGPRHVDRRRRTRYLAARRGALGRGRRVERRRDRHRTCTRTIPMSCSSRAAARAGPRARCSRTASTCCGATPVRCSNRAVPWSARTRCGTWERGPSLCSNGRPATRSSSSTPPMPVPSPQPWRATVPPGSMPSRRCGGASWTRARPGQPCPPWRRCGSPTPGTSATPLELLEAIERAAPAAHIRVFYGSTEAGKRGVARPR